MRPRQELQRRRGEKHNLRVTPAKAGDQYPGSVDSRLRGNDEGAVPQAGGCVSRRQTRPPNESGDRATQEEGMNGQRGVAAECGIGTKCAHRKPLLPRWTAWLVLTLACGGCPSIRVYRADRHISAGEALVAENDLEAALVEFQAAAALAPQLAVPHSRMGAVYRRMGEYEDAIRAFVEAIRRNPFSFDDTYHLAQLYQFTNRLREAIQAYLQAVELRSADFDAQLNLGACYQRAGDFSQAADRFAKAIEIDPNRPHAYVNLGVALDAQQKYYEAIRAYKNALERDHRQPLVLVNLAQTYMNQDRLKLARLALQEAINLDSSLAAAHEALGYCLFRSRDFGAAERSYSQALSCDPKLPRAHAGLGAVYMLRYREEQTRTDFRDRALEHWHRSLEIDPDQPRIRKLIAEYTPPPESDPEEVLLSERSRR